VAHLRTPFGNDLVRTEGPGGILIGTAQRAVQLFLYSWSKGLFGPISISAAAHLFTKQLLCQLSYAGLNTNCAVCGAPAAISPEGCLACRLSWALPC
jgi:hypothetical protein